MTTEEQNESVELFDVVLAHLEYFWDDPYGYLQARITWLGFRHKSIPKLTNGDVAFWFLTLGSALLIIVNNVTENYRLLALPICAVALRLVVGLILRIYRRFKMPLKEIRAPNKRITMNRRIYFWNRWFIVPFTLLGENLPKTIKHKLRVRACTLIRSKYYPIRRIGGKILQHIKKIP